LLLHALPTVGLLLQGLLYLTTPKFMPYHAAALEARWEDLSPHYRAFILGVIRAMGAGSFSVSLALLLILLIPLRRGERWALWATPVIGITFTLLTAYAAYTIDVGTPADTPWRQTCGVAAVYALGAAISYVPRASKSKS
jgi:hypothetical protein